MIKKTHSKQRRRTGSTTRRRTATTGSVPPQCNSESQLTVQTGHQWIQLLLQLLGEASVQLSGFSTGKHVAGSWWTWWSVQTPACHAIRNSASVGCVQWCDDSSVSRRIERSTLSVVIHGLPLLPVMCIRVSEPQFGYGTLTDTEEYHNIPLLSSSL